MYIVFLGVIYYTFNRLQCNINITFICTGKLKICVTHIFLNWNTVALQCVASFSAMCIYVHPLPLGPASHPPRSHPSRPSQSSKLGSVCRVHGSFPLAVCFTRGSVYMSVLLSQLVPPSLPLPTPMSPSLFCLLIPAQQIGSSAPFLYIPYIYINVCYLVFSF